MGWLMLYAEKQISHQCGVGSQAGSSSHSARLPPSSVALSILHSLSAILEEKI